MAKLSEIQQAKINAMLKQGKSYVEIAKILNVNSLIISNYAKNRYNEGFNTLHENVSGSNKETETTIFQQNNESKKNGVFIGFQESGEKVYWDPRITSNPHLMIVGESGTGKTYAMTALIAELHKIGIPSFIIDYSNSYSITKFPISLQRSGFLKELHVGSQGLKLNPLEIRKEDIAGPISVAVRVAGTFSRIYNLGAQQKAELRDAIIQVFSRHGINKDNRNSWQLRPPFLSEVNNYLAEIAQDEEYHRRNIAESLRAHISDFFIYNTFSPNGIEFSWQDAIDSKSITILQLQGLDGTTKKVVVDFLLWDIYGFMADKGEKPLTGFVLLDEAHNLSFKEDSPVEKILREARKFGIGTIIASQQPEDFSDVAFSNTSTKICFQISVERGQFIKKLASRSSVTSEELKGILTTIRKHHAFVLTGNQSWLCRIASFEERGF